MCQRVVVTASVKDEGIGEADRTRLDDRDAALSDSRVLALTLAASGSAGWFPSAVEEVSSSRPSCTTLRAVRELGWKEQQESTSSDR